MSKGPHLGAILLEEELLTAHELEAAVASQVESGLSLGQIVVERGMVAEVDLVRVVARQIGIEFFDLSNADLDPLAMAAVPDYLIRRHTALPVAFDDEWLVVAMADPANVLAIDDLRTVSGYEIAVRVAVRSELEAAIRRQVSFEDSVNDLAELAAEDTAAEDVQGLSLAADDAPVVRLVNTMVSRAVNDRASDIHLEPGEYDLRVRFRIDGVLHEVMTAPRTIAKAVVSRIKIISDLDIAERRLPQDGRVSVKVGGKSVDLRTATLPGIFGEKVVLRILDKSAGVPELESLGFSRQNLDRYARAYTKPYGAILVTGPTGSGKTTTLYSTLGILNRPAVNIITVEDPVEYRMPGITQVQVNRKAGLLFANALKSILRTDPDVLLIGEVRDRETAKIAVESALTGHLVLSTLHTNDASSSIGRLIDMGVESFLVGSSIDAVVAQRLARRLCQRCRVVHEPAAAIIESAGVEGRQLLGSAIYRAEGCATCAGTGYRGRVALNEVLLVNDEVQHLIVGRAPAKQILAAAQREGMKTLRQDGFLKVAQGTSSLEEILRVVG